MYRYFIKPLLVIITFAFAITAALQAYTAIYDFSEPVKFSGDTIHNPYNGIDSAKWLKANFHCHQRLMYGAMDFEYTEAEMQQVYRDQGYDLQLISDHQYINPYSPIPVYEHGWGANNFHKLMLGADKIEWVDYPIMVLPAHQMQWQLDKLKPQAELLVMNHPSRHRFTNVDDFRNLQGYDLMEMNPDRDDTAWDLALSAGIHSNLIANDDAHSISNRKRWIQACFTMVNAPSTNKDDIFEALEEGRAYGVAVGLHTNNRPKPHENLPAIEQISLTGDTIFLKFSQQPQKTLFIGQDGSIKAEIVSTDSTASYIFATDDTYIRTKSYFEGENEIWTNPFYRVGGNQRETAIINTKLTIINSIAWGALSLLICAVGIKLLRSPRGARSSSGDNYYAKKY